jgi:hypothetical protein
VAEVEESLGVMGEREVGVGAGVGAGVGVCCEEMAEESDI